MRHKHIPGASATYLLCHGGEVIITIGCRAKSCQALTADLRIWHQSLGDFMSSRGLCDADVLLVELDPISAYWVVYLLMTDGRTKEAIPVFRMRQCGEETHLWDVEVIEGANEPWTSFGLVRGEQASNLTQGIWQMLARMPKEAAQKIGLATLRLGFQSWRQEARSTTSQNRPRSPVM